MSHTLTRRIIMLLVALAVLPPLMLITFLYVSRASAVKANIVVDVKQPIGFVPSNWKALAQGGEEKGVRMIQNAVPSVRTLSPHYIRLDHIYDFYDVVTRDGAGRLIFNWSQLDQTVCDIYATGAQPFFALGYMPPTMSEDGSLIGKPKNWNEWSLLVQSTIERYSGVNTVLCNGSVSGQQLLDIHYEVWNEPDLESFGKWSLYDNNKSYRTLYYYSVVGAQRARNVQHFLIGGPATTAAYRNWFQVFLDWISQNNLRIDFLSWHHYTKNTDDYSRDGTNIDQWLADDKYAQYRNLPRMITEWGYDPAPNPAAQTNIGAAHAASSIKKLIDTGLTYAFAFEIKDGVNQSWGMLTRDAQKKPRYYVFELLNKLDKNRLKVDGEGTYVNALATAGPGRVSIMLVNYDVNNSNTEQVPVTINNLSPGNYKITITTLRDRLTTNTVDVTIGAEPFSRSIIMPPSTVVVLEIQKVIEQ